MDANYIFLVKLSITIITFSHNFSEQYHLIIHPNNVPLFSCSVWRRYVFFYV